MKAMMLVGIDFSAPADAALKRAGYLSEQLDATIEVMHVLETPDITPLELDLKQKLWLEARGVRSDGVTLARGVPWIELTRRARTTSALYLVIGTQGRSGRQPLALGSTAARLAVAAPCPVLLVKAPGRPSNWSYDELATAGVERPYAHHDVQKRTEVLVRHES